MPCSGSSTLHGVTQYPGNEVVIVCNGQPGCKIESPKYGNCVGRFIMGEKTNLNEGKHM